MKDLQPDKAGDQISKEATINDFIKRGSSDFFGEIIIRFVMFFTLSVSMETLGKNPEGYPWSPLCDEGSIPWAIISYMGSDPLFMFLQH